MSRIKRWQLITFWIALILCLPYLSYCDKPLSVKFTFNQIDSLVSNNLKLNKGANYAIANVYHYVGSRFEGNKKYASNNNYFEIYFLTVIGSKLYVQKVDNYSFFKRRKLKNKNLHIFLDTYYADMQKEKLSPQMDTAYNSSGDMITSYTVLDHQLYQNISIYQSDTLFHYSFHSTLMENNANLTTYQYLFLDILNKVKDKYKGSRLKP